MFGWAVEAVVEGGDAVLGDVAAAGAAALELLVLVAAAWVEFDAELPQAASSMPDNAIPLVAVTTRRKLRRLILEGIGDRSNMGKDS